MTHKILRLKKATLPYTSVKSQTPSLEKSIEGIKILLLKFGCQQFNYHEDRRGDIPLITLRFEKLGQVYMIEFPVTYIGPALDMRVSGRIMYHHIKAMLMAVETGYLDFKQAMMGYRALHTAEGMITLQEAYDRAGDALPAAGFDIRLALPSGDKP